MYYGVGFGIGLIGVFFFFNNRGCSWLPGNRVKEMVAERIIYISDANLQILKNLNISEGEIGTYIQDAEIIFQKVKKTQIRKSITLREQQKTRRFLSPNLCSTKMVLHVN
jgi:hypothetical protein